MFEPSFGARLATGGASDNSYVDALGKRGRIKMNSACMAAPVAICNNCGRALKRIVVGGERNVVCEECQV